jgi:hypothetical protein
MRKLAFALALGLLASVGGLGASAQSAAASSTTKVVIVVGATQGTTASYRSDGDAAATTFAKYTSNIVKVYSPNATWANVQAAAQGASVLVYIGHGSGYPNPYNGSLVAGDNGMGLNATAGNGDSNTQYYGAGYMAQLGLAANAVVLLNHLCYASGDSEGGLGNPTLSVAQTRVDGYASGFLRGNARAVIAEGMGSLSPYIDAIFSKSETIDQMWKTYPGFHNHVSSWASTQNSGYTSQIDPNLDHPQSDGDVYYRSMVSLPSLSTNDIVPHPVIYSPSTFHPIAPVRLLDTRIGNGLSGPLSANVPATFQITGRGGIPSNAAAVTGNLTVTDETNSWAIYLGPDPVAAPTSSTLNFVKGDIMANGVTVALGSGGTLSATYMAWSGNTANLVFDVTGYFTPDTSGSTYHPVNPARLLDTRVGNGLSSPLHANTPATFQITGRGGIPANATAVTGNVTVTDETDMWALYLGPDPIAYPGSSTINFVKGDIKANGLTVALGSGGRLSATYMAWDGNTTNLVFDVTGYFTNDASGVSYTPMAPARLLDTRVGNGLSSPLLANTPATFQITGRAGIPSAATGVTANVTVTDETDMWAIFVGPVPTASPGSSTLNFVKGNIRANNLTVALGSGGTLSATYMAAAGNTTSLVLDVTGYFAP